MMVKIEQEVRRSWTLEEFHLFYFMYCVVKLFHSPERSKSSESIQQDTALGKL